MKTRLAIGCMTGTSLDGLDAALIETQGEGSAMTVKVVSVISRSLSEAPDRLQNRLRTIADQVPLPAGEMAKAARDLAIFHVAVLRELLDRSKIDGRSVSLIATHGQTVFHAPPVSWQLINPAPICHSLGAPVVFDLRAADLAAGGQGAPITPIADWVLFRDTRHPVTVVNLGGFCNITRLQADAGDPARQLALIHARDVCACNQAIDAVARAALGSPFDTDGAAASRGRVNTPACDELARLLRDQSRSKRSLGTGDELAAWVTQQRSVAPDDLARTVVEAVATVIGEAVSGTGRVIAAGGGARHPVLMERIGAHAHATVETTESLGIPIDHREAIEMGVLGALCQDRVPITLPNVTGAAAARVSGCWMFP